MKTTPREPTAEMMEAGARKHYGMSDQLCRRAVRDTWRAMHDAAPPLPQDVAEDAGSSAYRQGYRDGYVDARHPGGFDGDEREVWREIDTTAISDGFQNWRDNDGAQFLAALPQPASVDLDVEERQWAFCDAKLRDGDRAETCFNAGWDASLARSGQTREAALREKVERAFRKGHEEGYRAADTTSRSQASHVEDAWIAYGSELLDQPAVQPVEEGSR